MMNECKVSLLICNDANKNSAALKPFPCQRSHRNNSQTDSFRKKDIVLFRRRAIRSSRQSNPSIVYITANIWKLSTALWASSVFERDANKKKFRRQTLLLFSSSFYFFIHVSRFLRCVSYFFFASATFLFGFFLCTHIHHRNQRNWIKFIVSLKMERKKNVLTRA